LKGISEGDVAAVLEVVLGEGVKKLTPSVLSDLKREWTKKFHEWSTRDLSEVPFAYLYADGIYQKNRGDMFLMSKNQTKTATLLRTSFDNINHIIHRAVERRLARRENTTVISSWAIDEESIKSNHHYVTVLSDLSWRRVLDVVEHRTEATTQELIAKALTSEQQHSVKAI